VVLQESLLPCDALTTRNVTDVAQYWMFENIPYLYKKYVELKGLGGMLLNEVNSVFWTLKVGHKIITD
jgi:hypothetical protein